MRVLIGDRPLQILSVSYTGSTDWSNQKSISSQDDKKQLNKA